MNNQRAFHNQIVKNISIAELLMTAVQKSPVRAANYTMIKTINLEKKFTLKVVFTLFKWQSFLPWKMLHIQKLVETTAKVEIEAAKKKKGKTPIFKCIWHIINTNMSRFSTIHSTPRLFFCFLLTESCNWFYCAVFILCRENVSRSERRNGKRMNESRKIEILNIDKFLNFL